MPQMPIDGKNFLFNEKIYFLNIPLIFKHLFFTNYICFVLKFGLASNFILFLECFIALSTTKNPINKIAQKAN